MSTAIDTTKRKKPNEDKDESRREIAEALKAMTAAVGENNSSKEDTEDYDFCKTLCVEMRKSSTESQTGVQNSATFRIS